MRVTGGTDVRWSPSWDYFNNVFLKILQKMGISVETQLIKRGYYPKGGGEAILTINPSKEIRPLYLDKQQVFSEVAGILNIANLPDHIGTRMKHAAIKTLLKKNLKATIKIEEAQSFSPGTGITLWMQSQDAVIGSTNLGEVGIPAEKIGEDAASQILQDMDAGVTIDIHAFDQIIPYMVIAREKGPSSCIVREISSHTQTNMWLLKQFFDVEFESKNLDKAIEVTVE
jgi:RNA 3'-phosphate cyclase